METQKDKKIARQRNRKMKILGNIYTKQKNKDEGKYLKKIMRQSINKVENYI